MVHVVQNVELQCMTFSETRFQFLLRLIFKKGQITVLFSTRKTVCGSKFVAKIYWDWQWQAESSIRFWNFTLSRAVLAKLVLPHTLFGKLYPLFILYKWRKTYTLILWHWINFFYQISFFFKLPEVLVAFLFNSFKEQHISSSITFKLIRLYKINVHILINYIVV